MLNLLFTFHHLVNSILVKSFWHYALVTSFLLNLSRFCTTFWLQHIFLSLDFHCYNLDRLWQQILLFNPGIKVGCTWLIFGTATALQKRYVFGYLTDWFMACSTTRIALLLLLLFVCSTNISPSSRGNYSRFKLVCIKKYFSRPTTYYSLHNSGFPPFS